MVLLRIETHCCILKHKRTLADDKNVVRHSLRMSILVLNRISELGFASFVVHEYVAKTLNLAKTNENHLTLLCRKNLFSCSSPVLAEPLLLLGMQYC